jgi:hypothetical protein
MIMNTKFTIAAKPISTSYTGMTFENWIHLLAKRITAILGTGIVTTVGSTIYGALKASGESGYFNTAWLHPLVSAIQAIVIFLVLIIPQRGAQDIPGIDPLSPSAPDISVDEDKVMKSCGHSNIRRWMEAKSIVAKVLAQFKTAWLSLWICWLLLYVVLTGLGLIKMGGEEISDGKRLFMYAITILATLFNNCATLMILFCYLILAKPTVPPGKRQTRHVNWVQYVTVIIFFTVVESLLVIMAEMSPDISHSLNPKNIMEVSEWISGIAAGTTTALLSTA